MSCKTKLCVSVDKEKPLNPLNPLNPFQAAAVESKS